MRITTALNGLLRLPGASVIDVSITPEAIIVTVRLRRRRRICAGCGQTGRQLQIHGRRVKRWRHLDLGASRCVIECELRRLRCPACGIHLEPVAWARPDAHHTRDFENVVAWLAQQMAKTQITRLLRVGWATVGRIVTRVVADQLDERRLSGLVAIGCDEISYRRGQRYLTSVVDHESGAIVWCAAGRNAATLQRFFDELGDRRESIRAVSIDMAGGYAKAFRDNIRDAEICFARFTWCASASARSIRSDATSGTPTTARAPRPASGSRTPAGRCSRAATSSRSASSPCSAKSPKRTRRCSARSSSRRNSGCSTTLRIPALAPAHLDAWLAWASRSRLAPFVRLARTIRRHRAGILAAIRLGLSNGRLDRGHRRPRRHGDR